MGYLSNNDALAEAIENMEIVASRIAHTFFIPTLDRDRVNDDIVEMFEYMNPDNIESLEQQFPSFKLIYKSYENLESHRDTPDFYHEFVDDLIRNCDRPLLVKVELCQNVYSVHFDEDDNSIRGHGCSWNTWSSHWVLAHSHEDAILQATSLGDANLREHAKKLND